MTSHITDDMTSDTTSDTTGDITNLAGISRYWATAAPGTRAITAGERTWTFAELDAEACRVAQGLQTLGVGAGSRVAYLDKNTPEYFTHLFGGAKLNAVSVAVNWRLAPPEMEFIIDDADAEVLFVGEEFLGHLAQLTAAEGAADRRDR